MFGLSASFVPRPYEVPQRYRSDLELRPQSPDPLSHTYPRDRSNSSFADSRDLDDHHTAHHPHSHHHHHQQHHNRNHQSTESGNPHSSSGGTPQPEQTTLSSTAAAVPSNTASVATAGSVVPIRQREVVFPTRRAPRHPPPPPLQQRQPSSTESEDTSNTASSGSRRHAASSDPQQNVGPAMQQGHHNSLSPPSVPVSRGNREQQQPPSHHHRRHHPRRAHSSELHRPVSAARNAAASTSTQAQQNSSSNNHNAAANNTTNASGNANGAGRLSDMLAVGLRGLQTYMGMMFQSSNHGGMNLHPTPYEAESANSYYRVPESPPPLAQRTSSEIVPGRERTRRVRAHVCGISIDEQHHLLRRLRYLKPATISAADTESMRSCPNSISTAGSPLSALTPLSTFGRADAGYDEPSMTLESWVVSLEAADSLQVPYPAISQSCSVCLRRFHDEEDVAELPCGHLYHFSCIIRWLQRQGSCPCCRADVRKMEKAREGNDNDADGEAAEV